MSWRSLYLAMGLQPILLGPFSNQSVSLYFDRWSVRRSILHNLDRMPRLKTMPTPDENCPSQQKNTARECVWNNTWKAPSCPLCQKKTNEIASFFFQASGGHKAIKVSAISDTYDQRKEGSFHLDGVHGGFGELVWFPTNSLMYTSQFGNAITLGLWSNRSILPLLSSASFLSKRHEKPGHLLNTNTKTG